MNRRIIREIDGLRSLGMQPTAISKKLRVSINTVKSHIRRHPEIPGTLRCLACGRPVMQTEGRKQKKYCSDKCRNAYWNERYREIKNEGRG